MINKVHLDISSSMDYIKKKEIDKKYIDLSSPIKTLGEHEVRVKFSNDISGSFKLTIEKED